MANSSQTRTSDLSVPGTVFPRENQMHVLVRGFHYDNTVLQLKQMNPDWSIVWIGSEQQRRTHSECEFGYENLQYGRIGNTPFSGAYADQYPKAFDECLYFLRMMTRVSGDGWIDWTLPDYLNLFNLQYAFFAGLFLRHRTDLVLFSALPHEGFDCVAYLLARALGTCIVEKHFTLSRATPGPDSAFSLEPAEFKEMVAAIRTVEKALGRVSYELSPSKAASRVFRRSLFVVTDVAAGELFTEKNVRSTRPGHGLHPKHLSEVLGHRATRAIPRGTPLEWNMFASSGSEETR